MKNAREITPLFVALIAGIGMFLSTLDSAIINVAIPTLIQVFHRSLDTIIWTITLYLLVLSSTIMLFGQLADRYGRLTIYRIGLILFMITSLLCGFSPSIHWLIVFRGFQGLGAAMMQATAIAVITTRLQKREMTQAVSILTMLMGLGPALGPVVGGFLLSTIGWQWIFWINIPFCLYALYGCESLKIAKETLHAHPIGYLNLALFGFSMLLLLLGIQHMNLFFFALMIIVFACHFYIDKNAEYPMIHYRLFKKNTLIAPLFGLIAMGGATAIVFILPPLFLQDIRHLQAWQVGLVSAANAFGVILVSRLFPRLSRRWKIDQLMTFGTALMMLSLLSCTQIKADWSTTLLFTLLFFYGLGAGFFVNANTLYLTAQFSDEKQGFISALLRMAINIGIAISSAAAALFISLKPLDMLSGIQNAWWLATVLAMMALIPLLCLFTK